VRGELPGLWRDDLFWAIRDHETVTGMPMDLDSVLALDHFIAGCNRTHESSEPGPYVTFFDPDMGMLGLRSVSGKDWTVRCLNMSTRAVDWETKVDINSENYIHHACLDMDSDGSNEMILVDTPKDIYNIDNGDKPPATGSLVIIDGSGRILFERSGFDASLPIKRSNGRSYIAGMTIDGFCCYDINHNILQYKYPSDQSMNKVYNVLVSEWNETGANVSFLTSTLWKEDRGPYEQGMGYSYRIREYKYSIYRPDRRTEVFEKIATIMSKHLDLIDLGSTVGIVFDQGSRLYTFLYDDSKVRADYPSICVPEMNLGINGLRTFLNGSEMEVDTPLITPFPDPAPIFVLVVLIALVLNRSRHHIKKNGLLL
jgi:hypothetical protein